MIAKRDNIADRLEAIWADDRARLKGHIELVRSVRDELRQAVEQFPRFRGRASRIGYPEYLRSFEVTAALADAIKMRLSRSVDQHSINYALSDVTDDATELLADVEHDRLSQEKDTLIALIELQDALDRLSGLPGPAAAPTLPSRLKQATRKLAFPVGRLQDALNAAQKRLGDHLAVCQVARIPLHIGDYPPLETTRVLRRADQSDHDQIEIAEIAEVGYCWNNHLLRKAAVVVISKKG